MEIVYSYNVTFPVLCKSKKNKYLITEFCFLCCKCHRLYVELIEQRNPPFTKRTKEKEQVQNIPDSLLINNELQIAFINEAKARTFLYCLLRDY